MNRSVKMLVGVGLPVAMALMLAGPKFARAACVDGNVCAGYDLFQTTTGTNFEGIPFQGVPLGSFDFGGGIGV